KAELQTYILLLCANADGHESEEELKMIKSKTDQETFERIYKEFSRDTEQEGLEKIDTAIHLHRYSIMEIAAFRREMYEIFFSDCNFTLMEKNLDRILDNIIY
ncbi:MAG TPA: hypothetical protein VJ945_06635, partial [Flavobacteriaceae bacterium]|nr:hypothetical protein [Flavobacteriaceae bacterium]